MRWNLLVILGCVPVLLSSIANAQMGPAQVHVAPVEVRPVELTQPLVATVMPVTRTTVAAEQEGLLEAREFDEGQRVEKGALLSRVNTDLLRIELEAAQAATRTAEAQLEAVKLQFENAQREVQRLTQLFETRVAPEKEYRDALTMRDVAAANIATQKAILAEKAAEVHRLETMLRKAETRSPLSGVVARRHVEVGEWIQQGAAVADVLQLDPLFVEVHVPEHVIARVQRGDPAQVYIDAMGRKTFTGTIDQILPLADPASRTFRVKILVPNAEFAIWPGFFARAVLISGSAEPMYVVPRDALVTREGQTHVVAVRDGQAAIVPVELGPGQGEKIAVTGELKEGEQVVIRGNETLMPGTPLIVMASPGAAPPGPGGAESAAPATQQSSSR